MNFAFASDTLGAKLMTSGITIWGPREPSGVQTPAGLWWGSGGAQNSFTHYRAHSTHWNNGNDTVLLFRLWSGVLSQSTYINLRTGHPAGVEETCVTLLKGAGDICRTICRGASVHVQFYKWDTEHIMKGFYYPVSQKPSQHHLYTWPLWGS